LTTLSRITTPTETTRSLLGSPRRGVLTWFLRSLLGFSNFGGRGVLFQPLLDAASASVFVQTIPVPLSNWVQQFRFTGQTANSFGVVTPTRASPDDYHPVTYSTRTKLVVLGTTVPTGKAHLPWVVLFFIFHG